MIFSNYGALVNLSLMRRILDEVKLRWEMHPAQLLSLEHSSYLFEANPRELTNAEQVKDLYSKFTAFTLMGYPITVREDYPKSWIRLYQGSNLIASIESLAIPATYGNFCDWDKEQASENLKACILRERDKHEQHE